MMIPEAWEHHESMPDWKRDFYRFHSSVMEPWDGPAPIAFTDGTVIGAVLDRNGLRPSRYWVNEDGLVVMASEVGVRALDPRSDEHPSELQSLMRLSYAGFSLHKKTVKTAHLRST